jgi:hypothetical protein
VNPNSGASATDDKRPVFQQMIERACDGENAFDVIAVHGYEREHPGDMIHIDIRKLGRFDKIGHRITGDRTGQSNSRGVGREFVHVCIDEASRVALSQILLRTQRDPV